MSAGSRSERGFTLIELLIAMTLMLVVTSATLAVFATMERRTRDNQRINDQERQARVATDLLAKRLRNLASPNRDGIHAEAVDSVLSEAVRARAVFTERLVMMDAVDCSEVGSFEVGTPFRELGGVAVHAVREVHRDVAPARDRIVCGRIGNRRHGWAIGRKLEGRARTLGDGVPHGRDGA